MKVLDFGIAKMIEPLDPNIQQFKTRTGTRMFTLAYASPEQIKKEPITTGTDTNVLGIILFELLVGIHPFDIKDKGLTEIEDIVRNQTAENPSRKLESLSKSQQKSCLHC